ncbi:MAG: phage integrase SAM-like domain-containing protein, partial [Prevotellaceae bacterium]|nr:phage integrase SAM-like domain-containing protein [Prevotellaceae bacterium]
MMKELTKTKSTVRLRKVEDRKEWYLYIESYPVFVPGKKQPQRVREYLNRTVSSVEWDKKRTARTDADGSKTFKPKRDDNGLIICRSEKDRETILYADGVRKLRQREYDNADLYSDTETAQAEQKERSGQNFIEYFDAVAKKRHAKSSESIVVNWRRVYELLKIFAGDTLPFSKIDNRLAEDFRIFMLSAPCGGTKKGTVSQNTAATYFSIFKAGLKQAFIDGYLTVDLSAKIKGIQEQETRREFLTVEELNTLVATPCEYKDLKRAA